jgi:hypothetical protein
MGTNLQFYSCVGCNDLAEFRHERAEGGSNRALSDHERAWHVCWLLDHFLRRLGFVWHFHPLERRLHLLTLLALDCHLVLMEAGDEQDGVSQGLVRLGLCVGVHTCSVCFVVDKEKSQNTAWVDDV